MSSIASYVSRIKYEKGTDLSSNTFDNLPAFQYMVPVLLDVCPEEVPEIKTRFFERNV